MLGIRTWGRMMVGIDGCTEPSLLSFNSRGIFLINLIEAIELQCFFVTEPPLFRLFYNNGFQAIINLVSIAGI